MEKRKVNFNEYKGKYNEAFLTTMRQSAANISVEAMREQMYGFATTKEYANGETPDEFFMDYWNELFANCQDDPDNAVMDINLLEDPTYKPEENHSDEQNKKKVEAGILWLLGKDNGEYEEMVFEDLEKEIQNLRKGPKEALEPDYYWVDTLQERRILEAIDSTGDGKSSETALQVIDIHQEYEYMRRVYPYCDLKIERQAVQESGIDIFVFKPNIYGVSELYFDSGMRW
jgi:hypothetical protein